MYYTSTRNKKIRFRPAQAIAQGLARDGGLFVPEVLPRLPAKALESLCQMSYQQRAVYVMTPFLDEFGPAEINNFAYAAYNTRQFDVSAIAPVHELEQGTYFLELWHGPTCAFKDMALQMLPHLMTASLKKQEERKQVCVLTATSGDTGKAALEGFRDVDRTKIIVFYPQNGVSEIQQLQMTTQEGSNVMVCAVEGNFDDAQTGVKRIFSDEAMREKLAKAGWMLSSANSINWGRLLPQIVYYISAYCDLVRDGKIALGDPINVCVPTGNFGNILAGYYAKQMGLPIQKFLCASNQNNVLTDFIQTGTYNKNRHFYNTLSPSMDILVSSNLERLLYELSDKDDALITSYMEALNTQGSYTVSSKIKAGLDKEFWAAYCSDSKTKLVIDATFRRYGYLIDPHTAVAYDVLNHYRHETGDQTPAVVVSTASPYKFCDSVLEALGHPTKASGVELIDQLAAVTGTLAPAPLQALKNKAIRFDLCVQKEDMDKVVETVLCK